MSIERETEYASQEERDAAEQFNTAQAIKRDEVSNLPPQPLDEAINNSEIQINEFQLTPEIQAKIMEKVKDINAHGTAFSSLTFAPSKDEIAFRERFSSVLEMGLLGTEGFGGDDLTREEFLKEWYENTRTKPVSYSEVYFNIIGRIDGVQGENQIAKTNIISSDGAGLLMDISRLKELPQGKYNDYERGKSKVTKTFSADRKKGIGYYTQTIGDWFRKPETGSRFDFKAPKFTGFVTPYRVAPRSLNGVIINSTNQEIINNYCETMIKVDKDKPERLMPVYNTSGDLLWPQRMSYEEVKAFVKERDSQKTEEIADAQAKESE